MRGPPLPGQPWIARSGIVPWYARSGGFVPTDEAGLALWLDASDASSITDSSGLVSQWNDKSGNARHMTQATGGLQPSTGVVTQNGLNVLRFENGKRMARTSFPITNTFTVLVVGALTNYVATTYPEFLGISAGTVNEFLFTLAAPDLNRLVAARRRTSFNLVTTATRDATNPSLLLITSGGSTIELSRNGDTPSSHAVTGTLSFTDTLSLGGRNASGAIDGWIAEVIIYNTLLSAEKQTALLGYAGSKWGVTLA